MKAVIKPRVIVYIDSIEKYKFFFRFNKAMKECNYEFVFITNRLSLKAKSYFDRIDVRLLKFQKANKLTAHLLGSREIIDNSLTIEEGSILFESTLHIARQILQEYTIKYAFIFGDGNIPELTIKQFAKEHNIKTLFYELANLPRKIFVDPSGTNASSSLYNDISILKQYPADKTKYISWEKEYLQLKEKELLPQQSPKRKKLNIFYLLDHIGFRLLNIPYEDNRSFFSKLSKKIWQKTTPIKFDSFDLKSERFIFMPMQVSNDAQILLNSTTDNCKAILYASKIAKMNNLALVVKPHPAETDPSEIQRIYDLKKRINFFLIKEPTLYILKYCEKVITINSTVGLEALIVGKPVEFIGNTIYNKMPTELLPNYIMSYLIDIDFFGSKSIASSQLKEILEKRL